MQSFAYKLKFKIKSLWHDNLVNYVEINQEHKDIIFGTSLGDGFLSTTKGHNWHYEATHSAKQKDYLFLKYEILKPFCTKSPRLYKKTNKIDNMRSYDTYRFATRAHPFFSFYGTAFYSFDVLKNSFVKDIPSLEILMAHLTPRSIAYWYMDDGAFYYGCLFCTECFSLDGLNRLKIVFFEKYSIVISLKKKWVKKSIKGYRIYINPINCEKFVPLIKPYVLPTFLYKFPLKYR